MRAAAFAALRCLGCGGAVVLMLKKANLDRLAHAAVGCGFCPLGANSSWQAAKHPAYACPMDSPGPQNDEPSSQTQVPEPSPLHPQAVGCSARQLTRPRPAPQLLVCQPLRKGTPLGALQLLLNHGLQRSTAHASRNQTAAYAGQLPSATSLQLNGAHMGALNGRDSPLFRLSLPVPPTRADRYCIWFLPSPSHLQLSTAGGSNSAPLIPADWHCIWFHCWAPHTCRSYWLSNWLVSVRG
jgi:hypothetical protein